MRSFLSGAILLLAAGCLPNNIARASCTNTVMATADPWTCKVTGAIVGQISSIEFDTESRNQVAQVTMTFSVTKGTLRIGYYDLAGEQHLVVTPSEPANLSMQTRMHRDRRSFTLMFEPVNGQVEGLAGTVKYSTP
jgi:hypothetical protein